MISKVELPNAQTYEFKYNSYSEVTRIELPTGGVRSYVWESGAPTTNGEVGGALIFRVVKRIVTSPDGVSTEGTTEITRVDTSTCSIGATSSLDGIQVDVERRVGTSSTALRHERHFYCGRPGVPAYTIPDLGSAFSHGSWKEGREFQTDIRNTSVGPVLRSSTTSWEQRPIVAGEESEWWSGEPAIGAFDADFAPAHDVRLKETATSLDTGQTSKTVFAYDRYNNQTDIDEYDFDASTPTRRTHLAYKNESAYVDAPVHLRRLEWQRLVCGVGSDACTTASSELEARTENTYDIGSLTDRSMMVGHDSAGFGTGYTTRGNPTEIRRWTTSSNTVSTFREYDIAGNVTKVTDPRGTTTTLDYADSGTGGGSTFAFPTEVVRAANRGNLARTFFASYDYSLGAMTKLVDEQSVVNPVDDSDDIITTFTYSDSLDRLTEASEGGIRKTTFSYNDAGPNPKVTTATDQINFNDQNLVSRIVFDGLGRELRTVQEEGGTACIATIRSYDGMGRAHEVTNPLRETSCSDANLLIGANPHTETLYDALSRVVQVIHPDGSDVDTAYSGATATLTDEADKVRASTTDGLGRLEQVVEDPGGLGYVTNYSYDALDNLRTVSQGVQTRTFVYDRLSRLTSTSNPEQTEPVTFTYDGNGNLLTRTDARDVVTTNAYDFLNRVTSTTYSDGTPPAAFCYDGEFFDSATTSCATSQASLPSALQGLPAPQFAQGRLTSLGNANSATYWAKLDPLGRVLEQTPVHRRRRLRSGVQSERGRHVEFSHLPFWCEPELQLRRRRTTARRDGNVQRPAQDVRVQHRLRRARGDREPALRQRRHRDHHLQQPLAADHDPGRIAVDAGLRLRLEQQ